MDYVIIVNDNGELKTISATEFDKAFPLHEQQMDTMLNAILDEREIGKTHAMALAEGSVDPDGYDVANETVDAKTRS